METKGRRTMRSMRQSPMLATVLAAAIPLLAACTKSAPSDLNGSGNGGSGGGDTSGGAVVVDDAPVLDKTGTTLLEARPRDYNESTTELTNYLAASE